MNSQQPTRSNTRMAYDNEKNSFAVDTHHVHSRDAEHDARINKLVADDTSLTGNDRVEMRRMGKKQEMNRKFRLISSVAFTSCVMGTWEILLTTSKFANPEKRCSDCMKHMYSPPETSSSICWEV